MLIYKCVHRFLVGGGRGGGGGGVGQSRTGAY